MQPTNFSWKIGFMSTAVIYGDFEYNQGYFAIGQLHLKVLIFVLEPPSR